MLCRTHTHVCVNGCRCCDLHGNAGARRQPHPQYQGGHSGMHAPRQAPAGAPRSPNRKLCGRRGRRTSPAARHSLGALRALSGAVAQHSRQPTARPTKAPCSWALGSGGLLAAARRAHERGPPHEPAPPLLALALPPEPSLPPLVLLQLVPTTAPPRCRSAAVCVEVPGWRLPVASRCTPASASAGRLDRAWKVPARTSAR